MNEEELRAAMKRRFEAMSIREWCRLTGCNVSHVSEFVSGKRGPPNDLLKALNLSVRYVRNRRQLEANTVLVEALEQLAAPVVCPPRDLDEAFSQREAMRDIARDALASLHRETVNDPRPAS